jgi:tetratricopeptide (TPR) repeat protein
LKILLSKINSLGRIILNKFSSIDNVGNRCRLAGDRSRDIGDWAEAVRQYREYLWINPNDFAILVQLGHALKEFDAKEAAARAYQAAYEIDPEDADLLLNLGHLYRTLGDLDGAANFYRRSFAIDRNEHAFNELQDRSLPGPHPEWRLHWVHES